jgi:hypothetical protein
MQWLDNVLRLCGIARAARRENAPREWLFVNAYGPQQARAGIPQTYGEALDFLKEHIGCSFVRADLDNAIIFFDGRKLGG